jgi:hypothetical protein
MAAINKNACRICFHLAFILQSFATQVAIYAYLTAMDRIEREYITRCKRMIEQKFHFGNGHGELRQRDFEYLADSIEEKSGITLSLSTLKRLWKNDYDKTPHPSTLQALVSVLEYKDWQEFKLHNTNFPEAPVGPPRQKRRMSFNPWMLAPIVLAVAVVFWLIAFRSKPVEKKPIIKGPVTLTGNKTVSQGVPNTVIFNYDLSNVEADSFFFQQSWNTDDRTRLDPKKHVYTTIYLFPGFHRAKLVANDSIIKRFFVHITTDGWFPMARYRNSFNNPIYIKKPDAAGDSVLHFSSKELASADVDTEKDYMTSFFNVRSYDANSDNFLLDTRFKCDKQVNYACQAAELTVMTEEHIYMLRLVSKGCEREATIKMGENVDGGESHDLSAFGRDLQQWQNLKIKVVDKQAVVYLDDKPVYTLGYKKDFGKIVGIVYHFTGTGAIDYVRLTNGENKLVYSDEFNN